ncbi:CRISPR-associated protein Cas2 [Breznakia sp. PF5-3]|uniref:CRISPR-associated endonuclease Cas2 n=1 Tax=unclassified Breznakia TaxID=2623764 RepID=UPI0024072B49|nr:MULTISPECIES: CRISPR-associated endonuclease Cas2 [unclassified Breznakia]MDF9824448.1 CRISPR-associated protein Cas2 [Breznakia sp. PM6-1]MDF9835269.1 CRISPR-associated protein Cas2 [Breznakia sp. PF5-3]MDF9837403.1 CRISPR-associated protein Cas2 [Breznakia sp. PFB2-8]MDF9859338.1 CRISPR-associated protein Cas2 [Breznakia sp. PH5-24]
MRVVLFFDLPMVTNEDKKRYRKFRKFLIKEGFIMVQESVYSKLVLNSGSARFIYKKVDQNKPTYGLIQLLTITEKQYNNIEFVLGKSSSNILDDIERVIII